jgi:hypothetical protein
MISIHVSENDGRGVGQRVRGRVFVFTDVDPAHHAKATDVIEINGLEAEEAEIGKLNPVAAVFVASEILLSNGSNIMFGDLIIIEL